LSIASSLIVLNFIGQPGFNNANNIRTGASATAQRSSNLGKRDLSHYNREYVLISKWACGHSESWRLPWYEVKDLVHLPQGAHPRYTVQQADLYHNARLIVNYLFTVLKRTPEQLSYTLGYMDVPRVQRQKFPLRVYNMYIEYGLR